MFQHCLGEGGREKGSERRTRIAHITMEACTVNFLLFAQNLTSVPKSFEPHCRSVCFNLGQLVSTQVSLGQVQNTGHRALFYQYKKYPKHSLKLTLDLIRPKQKFLSLMLALVNG